MEVKGKGGIYVKVVADSVSPENARITTLHCTYPRFIHSQVMTHRVFSRNARSSRAVPISKLIEEVRQNPAFPVFFGKNKKGMQPGQELSERELGYCYEEWLQASEDACFHASFFNETGLHKQVANRVLEPFLFIDTLITSTEWDNFFNLRLNDEAQAEIQELAVCIDMAMTRSDPVELDYDEWHLPYISDSELTDNGLEFNDLLLISAARCARISYKAFDGTSSYFVDLELAKRLLESRHMSPFEHQAKSLEVLHWRFQKGATHKDKDYNIWSNNFKNWIQHRAILEDTSDV